MWLNFARIDIILQSRDGPESQQWIQHWFSPNKKKKLFQCMSVFLYHSSHLFSSSYDCDLDALEWIHKPQLVMNISDESSAGEHPFLQSSTSDLGQLWSLLIIIIIWLKNPLGIFLAYEGIRAALKKSTLEWYRHWSQIFIVPCDAERTSLGHKG